jgi:ketosteroid isomerase-like protein
MRNTFARTAFGMMLALVATTTVVHAQGVTDLLTMGPTWQVHYNAADIDALLALYTDDAVIMAPDMPTVVGKDALRAINKAYMDLGHVSSEVPVVDAHGILGDVAWGAGSYRFFDADGNLLVEGKYFVLYRHEDGMWRIARHMWNNDHPVPTPAG